MIPNVDISVISLDVADTKDEDLRSVGTSIQKAFQTVGFCYLSNHGIKQSVLDEYMSVCLDFFNQPGAAKQYLERKTGGVYGWIGLEKETLNRARPGELKETFNFKPCESLDDWAQDDEKFRQLNISMFKQCSTLALRICDALSLALGLDKDFFRKNHALIDSTYNLTTLRSIFYPALGPDKEVKAGQVRCGEHTDFGTLTLLYQDESGGLEVKVPEKGYIPAPPMPGTFLINIGELMQRWTADDLTATEHRVVNPENETEKLNVRQSFGLFLIPDDKAVINCTDGSDKFEPVTSREYLMKKIADANA